MQIDPVQEWQRLTAEYREKISEELLELARDYADLTETAQQTLRQEMRSRALGDPENPKSVTAFQSAPTEPPQPPVALSNARDPVDIASGAFGAHAPQPVPDTPDAPDETAGPHEYTWKTPLCECYTQKEAAQLQEALRRAGIESWFNFGGFTTSFVPTTSQSVMFGDIQVLVAADQLDQARAIAAQPIPQDIIEESETETPEYEVPKCPKCGAEDPTLESAEPTNHWHCENCDAEWDDPVPSDDAAGPKP
jgi:hypothetical protein